MICKSVSIGTMVFGMMTGLAAEQNVYVDEPRIDASIAQLKRLVRVVFPKKGPS